MTDKTKFIVQIAVTILTILVSVAINLIFFARNTGIASGMVSSDIANIKGSITEIKEDVKEIREAINTHEKRITILEESFKIVIGIKQEK